MGCRENATDLLRSLGYCTIRLPKSDVAPLLLLSRQERSLDRFGRLDTVFVGDGSVARPSIHHDLPAANVSGQSSSTLRLGIGMSVLTGIISAMGGSPLGLQSAYRGVSRLSFEFRDVFEDRIDVAELDRYLASADLDSHSRYAERLLESDEMFVVTSTLKTEKIAVRSWDATEGEVGVDLPLLQEAVGGEINVSASSSHATIVTYAGSTRLVFAFQAYRIHYVDGDYHALVPGSRFNMRGQSPLVDTTELLKSQAPFVRIGEAN